MAARKSAVASSLGRAIIKSREKKIRSKKTGVQDSDDYEDSTKKIAKSIVEENDLDEFLAKADLSGTNFEAERENVKFISVDDNKLVDIQNITELRNIEEAQERLKGRLRIPRRPVWTTDMTANELRDIENRSFLEWRRELADLEQEEHILLTPFERNVEVWRQLWRVIERSDIIVQIVDARNPLLFRCLDLESYVKEIDSAKVNFILVNKADLLTAKQRLEWAHYFQREGIPIAFWSAATLDDESSQCSTTEPAKDSNAEPSNTDSDEDESGSDSENSIDDDQHEPESQPDIEASKETIQNDHISSANVDHSEAAESPDGTNILNRAQLMDLLNSFRPDKKSSDQTLTIGMVGYPNVGKSSTINKLIGQKKVAVSATPGKTKHFQTLFIDDKVCLCDCPGLVMPSFVVSKEEMIVSGILPCDEMRDCKPAIGVICSQIDRRIFERIYGIMLPKPGECDPPDRKPTPHELLTAYAFVRGFMSTKGIPDESRAARIIIKDYVNGRLRYCHAPPNVDQKSFDDGQEEPTMVAVRNRNETLAVLQRRHLLDEKPKTSDIDRVFFKDTGGGVHVKTSKKAAVDGKRHNNRNKKEKLRRLYGHLDA